MKKRFLSFLETVGLDLGVEGWVPDLILVRRKLENLALDLGVEGWVPDLVLVRRKL